MEEIFAAMESEAHGKFASQGIDAAGVALERSVRMRFSMQIHDVEVPVPAGRIDDGAVDVIDQRFEEVHDQLFGRGSGDRSRRYRLHGVPGSRDREDAQGRADLGRARRARPALTPRLLVRAARLPRHTDLRRGAGRHRSMVQR